MNMSYRKCQTKETEVGMLYFMSCSDGTGGRIKTEPEDFIVNEISNHPEPKEGGKFVFADITSRNWETNRLIRLMSRNIGISREKIGFAGTKDKRALTTQLMSFECSLDDIQNIDLKDVQASNIYTGKRAVQIGDLIGNKFEIRVKDCDKSQSDIPEILNNVTNDIKNIGGFPNYFGVQRFGVIRPITHKVGEFIVRGKIKEAVECYLSAPSKFEDEEVQYARKELSKREDWNELIKIMPKPLGFEKMMVGHLMNKPDDWAGALDVLPRNLQMMFIHAYQSYMFNLILSERISRDIPLNLPIIGDVVIPLDENKIPLHERPITVTESNIDLVLRQIRSKRAFVTVTLFGSESEFSTGEMGEIERSIIENENISSSDFITPALPHCSSKGSRREILCPINDLICDVDSDDGYKVSFSLPKGNYATCLLREFMKSEMERY